MRRPEPTGGYRAKRKKTLKQCIATNRIQQISANHISSGFSPASNRGDVGSFPGHSIQRFSFMQWHSSSFFSGHFDFALLINHLTPNDHFSGRTAPLTSRCCIFLFIQQIYVLNILNVLHTRCFSSSKCPLFHNATFFGSCIIHILYTMCAKI